MLSVPFSAFVRHRSLLIELTRREILGRYRGANFGLFWSLLSPFLMLGVYVLAFGFVLPARWPEVDGRQPNFALVLYAGLIVHGFFAECVVRSPSLVTGNPNFVKRVVFPLELLPWTLVLSALFHAVMGMVVFVILHFVIAGPPPPSVLMMPLVLLPLVPLLAGLSALLAALGVYVRDINQVTGVLATAALFLSSAIIPLSAIPSEYRRVFEINPLTFIIDQVREVGLWGHAPNWGGLALYLVVAFIVMHVGFACFAALRRGFADVV